MLIHLLENTVDIATTVEFRTKSVEIDRRCGFIPKKSVDRVFPRSRKKGSLTYGPIGGKKWSRTHIHQEVMVPCLVSNGPNTYPNIDTCPPICRPGRSITVDIAVDADSPTGEYRRYRRSMPLHLRRITVDRRLSIKNRHNVVVDFIDDTCETLLSNKQMSSGEVLPLLNTYYCDIVAP